MFKNFMHVSEKKTLVSLIGLLFFTPSWSFAASFVSDQNEFDAAINKNGNTEMIELENDIYFDRYHSSSANRNIGKIIISNNQAVTLDGGNPFLPSQDYPSAWLDFSDRQLIKTNGDTKLVFDNAGNMLNIQKFAMYEEAIGMRLSSEDPWEMGQVKVIDKSDASRGGAIYTSGALSFIDGHYKFNDNQTKIKAVADTTYLIASEPIYSRNNAAVETYVQNAAYGGAIYANGTLNIFDGSYDFSDNYVGAKAVADSSYSSINTGEDFWISTLVTGALTNIVDSAKGGAIYSNGLFNLGSGQYTFSGNRAEVSGYATSANSKINIPDAAYKRITSTSVHVDMSNVAHGGAIYANESFNLSDGYYAFLSNSVEASGYASSAHSMINIPNVVADYSGADAFTSARVNMEHSAKGGAIYANSSLYLGLGGYEFKNNTVTLSPLYADASDVNIKVFFEDTQLQYPSILADASAIIEAEHSALGGAIYGDGTIDFNGGRYHFDSNKINIVGAVSSTAGTSVIIDANQVNWVDYAHVFADTLARISMGYSGHGGAIYAKNGMNFIRGDYTFTNNVVSIADIVARAPDSFSMSVARFESKIDSMVDASFSAHGGAIYAKDTINFLDGTYVFMNNGVKGANARAEVKDAQWINAGARADYSGHGGAIYAMSDLNMLNGSYLFKNNYANGGWAKADNGSLYYGAKASAAASGLGGAIYTSGNLSLSGNIIFNNNSASTQNDGDFSSGRGGAIFLDVTSDGYMPSLAVRSHSLTTKNGQQIVFEGNQHNPGNMGSSSNSIYFGTTYGYMSNNLSSVLSINTEANSAVLMYDAMASQQDYLWGDEFTRYNKLNVAINKTGQGLWLLGGNSQMDSATTVTIQNGVFELYEGGQLNLNHNTTARFDTQGEGVTFKAYVPKTGQTWIKAKDINLAPGTNFKLTGVSALTPGMSYQYNKVLVADNSLTIGNGTLTDNDSLYTATLSKNGLEGNLTVTDIKNMSSTYGVDPTIDNWRKGMLALEQRASLDTLYQNKAISFTQQKELTDFAQQLSGRQMLQSLNVSLHNNQIFRDQINQRLFNHNSIKGYHNTSSVKEQVIGLNSANQISYQSITPSSGAWISNTHASFGQNNSINNYGYQYKPDSLTAGYDQDMGQWLIGAALQSNNGKAKSNNGNKVETTIKNYAFGVYSGYYTDQWYVNAGMQYAMATNDMINRFNLLGQRGYTSGRFNSNVLGFSLETGKPMTQVSGWFITPHIGVNYAKHSQDAITETGDYSFIRQFGGTSYKEIEIPVGIRFTTQLNTASGKVFKPVMDLSYVANIGDTRAKTQAYFISGGAHQSFQVEGIDTGRHILRANFGLNARLGKTLGLSGMFSLENKKGYDNQQYNLVLDYRF